MALTVFILTYVIVGYFAFYTFYYAKNATIRRTIRAVPSKHVPDVKSRETTRIIGNAMIDNESALAPLTGRHCIYYHVIIDKQVRKRKGYAWRIVHQNEMVNDFYIEQDGYKVLVDTTFFESSIKKDKKFFSGFLNDPDGRIKNYLTEYNIDEYFSPIGIQTPYRYREAIIEPGEKVAVVGKAKWKKKADIDNTKADKELSLAGSKRKPVLVSDYPSCMIDSYVAEIIISNLEKAISDGIKKFKARRKKRKEKSLADS